MKKIVGMNEVAISSEECPIIGTYALATCFGILLYEENKKIAVVGHCTSNWVPIVLKMLNLISDSDKCTFKYLVIPGFYSEQNDIHDTKLKIETFFNIFKTDKVTFEPFTEEYVIDFDEKTNSYEFEFDSKTGKFLSQKNNFVKK